MIGTNIHIELGWPTEDSLYISIFAECFNCVDSANRRVTNTTWGTGQTPNAAFGQTIGLTDPVVVPPRTFQFAVRYEF